MKYNILKIYLACITYLPVDVTSYNYMLNFNYKIVFLYNFYIYFLHRF